MDLVLTDPPYGQTRLSWDAGLFLTDYWDRVKQVIKSDGVVVMCAAGRFYARLVISNIKWYRHEWIWNEHTITGWLNANRCPLVRHEYLVVFSAKGPRYYPQKTDGKPYTVRRGDSTTDVYGDYTSESVRYDGERYPTSILDQFGNRSCKQKYPTQKPVDLFRYIIRTYTAENDLVLDPFVGSGTTALAAVLEKRNWMAGDNNPEAIELAQQRLDNLNGLM